MSGRSEGRGGGEGRSGPPPDIEGMLSLKVDNLTYRTTPDDLRRAFEKYGEVGDVYIPRDRFSRESRGFAFVRFHDKRDGEDAMDAMDGAIMDGRELRVQMARYGRPPGGGSGGGGGGGGRRGGGGYGGGRDRDRGRRRSYSRSRSRSHSRDRRDSGRDSGRDRRRSRSPKRSRSRSQSRSRSRSRD